jgi:hypothetical protein
MIQQFDLAISSLIIHMISTCSSFNGLGFNHLGSFVNNLSSHNLSKQVNGR